MNAKDLILIFFKKITNVVKKHLILILTCVFLALLFCLLYTKYLITKINSETNKTKQKIEEQLILQQGLKIKLQKNLSIENLKIISSKHMPSYSYTNSSRIVTKKEKIEINKEEKN